MSAELLDLLKGRAEQQQQIRELADDNSVLTQQKKQAEAELERQVFTIFSVILCNFLDTGSSMEDLSPKGTFVEPEVY